MAAVFGVNTLLKDELQVHSLPSLKSVIPANSYGFDNDVYYVEYSSKTTQRFHSYDNPKYYQKKFWQAKNFNAIVSTLQKEIGFYLRRRVSAGNCKAISN